MDQHQSYMSYMVNGNPVYLKPHSLSAKIRKEKKKDYSHLPMCDQPFALPYLTSYRCMGRNGGWTMIGASNIEEAMQEAGRRMSNPDRSTLQIWDDTQEKYVPC